MKSILVILALSASTAFAQSKTGELSCFVESNGEVIRSSSEIYQNADGSGGVASVAVEGFGIRCSGTGVSKFGATQLINLSLTTPSGEEVSAASIAGDNGILLYGQNVTCACVVEAQ